MAIIHLKNALSSLDDEELKAVRATLKRRMREEEVLELVEWRHNHLRGLKFPPLTCAVCNRRTFLGPLCFDHMEAGRSMSTMWRDYVDPRRRDVARVEAFLIASREKNDPGDGLNRASSNEVEAEAVDILHLWEVVH